MVETAAESGRPKYRPLSDIKPGDEDLYARGSDGQTLQRCVSFGKDGNPTFSWRPILGGFCQLPSDRYMEALEEHGGDPRLVASDPRVRRQFGGHPEERKPGR